MIYRASLLISFLLLSSCMSSLFTGASLVYNRHTWYRQADDMKISMEARHLLFHDRLFKQKNVSLDLAVFHGDLLLAGHVPNAKLAEEAKRRMNTIQNTRRTFVQVAVQNIPSTTIEDSWITTQIKSQIIANADIDPNAFKIMTADGIVYLLGDVPSTEGQAVIAIARKTPRVKRVVTLLRYYHFKDA